MYRLIILERRFYPSCYLIEVLDFLISQTNDIDNQVTESKCFIEKQRLGFLKKRKKKKTFSCSTYIFV